MTFRNTSITPHLANYIPKEYFGELEYFQYMFGSAYLITVNVINTLVKGIDSFKGYIIDIEDVFITGILAEKLDINRETSDFLRPAKCKINCSIAESFFCWPCNDWEMKRRWGQYQVKLNDQNYQT